MATVVERAPALREGGYKVDIRGVALTVVDRMGLREQVRRHDTDMRSARFVDSAGAQLATMDAQLFGGREGADAEIMRGDPARILAAATQDVEYVFDDGEPAAAFAEYERRMRPFVEANQRLAERNLKGMVLRSTAQIRFQTLMLRLMPHLPGRNRMISRVTEPIRQAATAITLPNAPAPGAA